MKEISANQKHILFSNSNEVPCHRKKNIYFAKSQKDLPGEVWHFLPGHISPLPPIVLDPALPLLCQSAVCHQAFHCFTVNQLLLYHCQGHNVHCTYSQCKKAQAGSVHCAGGVKSTLWRQFHTLVPSVNYRLLATVSLWSPDNSYTVLRSTWYIVSQNQSRLADPFYHFVHFGQ